MKFTYLTVLCAGFFGMLVLDRRFALAFFADARRTGLTIAAGIAVFVVWDILGITFGIFFSGQSKYMSGWYIAPEFPAEELFFLAFLCYFTLIIYLFAEKQWRRI